MSLAPPLVRAAAAADTDAVRDCVVAAFAHYTPRIGKPAGPMTLDFAAEVAAGHVWVAVVHGQVAGALVQYETDEGFYIDTVAALPALQGTGVGRALLQFAEREALRRGHASVYLATNERMTENQAFYPRIGYVEVARRHQDGYDRIYYRKALRG